MSKSVQALSSLLNKLPLFPSTKTGARNFHVPRIFSGSMDTTETKNNYTSPVSGMISIPSRSTGSLINRIHHPYSRAIGPSMNAKEEYEKNRSWGMLTSIDAYGCDAELIRSEEDLRRYVIELCSLIDMKRYGETIIEYFGANQEVEGFSVVQLIETSCVTMHCANSTNVVYTDIFSCKSYDPVVAAKFTAEFFGAKEWDYNVLLRGVSSYSKKEQ